VLSHPLRFLPALARVASIAALLATLSLGAHAQAQRQAQAVTEPLTEPQESCPDLSSYYATGQKTDWMLLEARLSEIKRVCLESSEFFALHGAAQLNSGLVDQSLESLERALLIDPNNGAAQIDYGQAMYQKGQLFMALEINERLLVREDLPASLQPALRARQKTWKALTRQQSFQLDALGGYDNNLNGAPSPDQVTLTLSGEAIPLTLDTDFRPIGGSYVNLRLGSRYRVLAPEHQHNWATEVRARTSEDSASNLVQFTSRYAFIKPQDGHSWQLTGGLSHLNFGGTGLFTGVDTSARYQADSDYLCKPFYDLAVQLQTYQEQDFLNGVESKASAGLNCANFGATANQRITVELGILNNQALRSARLGGNRNGWQFKADWQILLGSAVLKAQLSHIQLDDNEGYSPLLDNGAERQLDRSYFLLQYRKPVAVLGDNSSLMINVYRQLQTSNIEFFRTSNTSAEIGLSWSF
jgi:hypothetical protein